MTVDNEHPTFASNIMYIREGMDIPTEAELWANDQSIIIGQEKRFAEAGRAIVGSPRPSDRWRGTEPDFNMETCEKIYLKSPLVFQAVNKTADHVMQAGFRIQGEDADNIKLIKEWIEYIGFHSFLHEVVRDLMIYGNTFNEVVLEKDLKSTDSGSGLGWGIAELKPLNPKTMRVYRYETGEVIGYIQRPPNRRWRLDKSRLPDRKQSTGQKQKHWKQEVKEKLPDAVVFDNDQIVHLKLNQLPSAEYGISPIEPVKESLTTYMGVMGDVSAIIKRYGSPKVIWRVGTPDRPPSKKMVDDFHASVTALSIGDDISVSGVVDWDTLDSGLKVMDMAPYIQFLRDDVFAGIGVPELIMGGNVTSAEATAEVILEAYTRKIMLMQRFLEIACRRYFFSRVIGIGTWPFTREDWASIPAIRFNPPETIEKSYLREVTLGTAGIKSIPEIRDTLGFVPDMPVGKTMIDLQKELAAVGSAQPNAQRPGERGPAQTTGKTGSDDKKKAQTPTGHKAKTKETDDEEE
jgi:hypothetical protein